MEASSYGLSRGCGNYFYQLFLFLFFLLALKTHWPHYTLGVIYTLGVMTGLISAEMLKSFPGLASAQCMIYRLISVGTCL